MGTFFKSKRKLNQRINIVLDEYQKHSYSFTKKNKRDKSF